jgi:hypothetical protein
MGDTEEYDLQTELDGLQVESGNVRQHIKISSAVEREFFAKTYVWWRKARDNKDYLAKAYSAKGIKFNATQNRINWRPLLKLVSDNKISRGDLATWSRCFDRIHDDVEKNPHHYAADPGGQISYYVESNGGKTGLAGYHDQKDDLEYDDDEESQEIWGLAYHVDLDELDPVFLALAKEYYSKSPAIPLPPSQPAHFSDADFGVAILRRGTGTADYVAAPNLPQIVDVLLQESYRSDFEATPLSLRCPLEAIHIATVPPVIASNLDRFIEYVKVQTEDGTKAKTKARKRLIFRPSSGDFLLSLTHLRASLCIVSKPQANLFAGAATDLQLLPTLTQRSMEVRLLHQRMKNIFAPSKPTEYELTSHSGISRYAIRLSAKRELVDFLASHGISEEQMLSHVTNLKHTPIAFAPVPSNVTVPPQSQPIISHFNSTWNCSISVAWLRIAVTTFFDRWIVEYGIKSVRTMNRVMSIDMDARRINVGYEFGEQWGFSNFKDLPPFVTPASGSASLIVRSSDFTFALRQIADLPVIGNLTLSASNEGMVASFATSACSHSVFIPACDDSGIRKTNWFSHYAPIQAQEPGDIGEDLDSGSEP